MHFNAIQTQRRLQSVLAKKEEERQRRLAAKRAAEEEKAAELRAAELRAKRAKRAARVRAHQVAAVVAIFECDPDKGCTRETIAKYVKEGELVMLEDEPGRNGFATAALREALDDGMSAGAFVLAPKAGRIRVADIPEDWSVHEKYRKELMRRKVCMSRLSACVLACLLARSLACFISRCCVGRNSPRRPAEALLAAAARSWNERTLVTPKFSRVGRHMPRATCHVCG